MKQFKAEIVRVDQVQSDKEGGGVSNRIKKNEIKLLTSTFNSYLFDDE